MRKAVQKNRNFTLIELLIIIAIIAILAGMLLPSLNKAMARVKTISCISNLKELGKLWFFYTDDYNGGLLPVRFTSNADYITSSSTNEIWYEHLMMQYLINSSTKRDAMIKSSRKVFVCPSDPGPRISYHQVQMQLSYGYCGGIGNSDPNPFFSPGSYLVKNKTFLYSEKQAIMGDTYAYYLFAENLSKWNQGANSAYILYRATLANLGKYGAHGRRMNIFFYDGHTENVDKLYINSSSGGIDLWNITSSNKLKAYDNINL